MKKIILFIFLMLFLSSCSSNRQSQQIVGDKGEIEEISTIESSVPSPEADLRGPIYTYSNEKTTRIFSRKEILLTCPNEPLLLPNGYVRLTGILYGEKPLAVIEIGGRGMVVEEGGSVGGYIVQRIDDAGVLLKKGIKKCQRSSAE